MIHYGKSPNEDKVIIEVGNEDLIHLRNVLTAMPLTERRGEFAEIKDLIESDPDLRAWLEHGEKYQNYMSKEGGNHVIL